MRLTIGKIANQAGVNTDTLRYYEREGIIAKPVRNGSNYRVYSDDTVLRVRFVKRAQELGFSLISANEKPSSCASQKVFDHYMRDGEASDEAACRAAYDSCSDSK